MRYFLLLLLCYTLQLNAQEDLDLNWGPTYDRLEAERQHFHYAGAFDGHYYIRTGKDRERQLQKLDATHKVVKTIRLNQQYQTLEAQFDRLLKMPTGMYGYFKALDADQKKLLLLVAAFDGTSFGELREIYQHDFVKVPGAFKGLVPIVLRTWSDGARLKEQLVYSPDSSLLLYRNVAYPQGARLSPLDGSYTPDEKGIQHIAVFTGDFQQVQTFDLPEVDDDYGELETLAIGNEGDIYGIGKLRTRKLDWKESLAGKYPPRFRRQLLRLVDGRAEILPIGLANDKAITALDLKWKPDETTLQLLGLYTDGVNKGMLTGCFVAEGREDTFTLLQANKFSTDLVNTEITSYGKYGRNYETRIIDKKIDLIRKFGTTFSLLAVNHNTDGSLSWVWERRKGDYLAKENLYVRERSVLYALQTAPDDSLLNERLIDKCFVATSYHYPSMLHFYRGDQLHLMYPNVRTLENRRALDEKLESGGLLEYLVLEPSGETAHFEILQSKLSYLFDFNLPFVYQNGHVLFGKLSRGTYSFGSFEVER